MSLEDWQIELRRQFGREQKFRLKNLGDHPALLRVPGHQPAEPQHLPRARFAAARSATTPAPAPTSPPTRSAPASTSSSRSPGSSASARRHARSRPAFSRRQRSAICSTARDGEVRFRPGADCPVGAGQAGRRSIFGADGCSCPTRAAQVRRVPAPQRRAIDPDLRCGDDVLAFSPRCATPTTAAREDRRGVPARASAAPRSRTCSRSRSTTTSAKAPCSPPAPAAA